MHNVAELPERGERRRTEGDPPRTGGPEDFDRP